MFEKEAEEYREKGKSEGYYLVSQEMEQEELDYIIDESFKDGAERGYNKANEWHYVRDGDLPSEEGGWVCNQDGLPCYFDWGTEQWLDCEGTPIRTTEWCHMPHKE